MNFEAFPGSLFRPDNFFYLFAASAALIVGWVWYAAWLRRKALAELAASMGLPFSPGGPDPEWLGRTGLEIFYVGRHRKAANLIESPGSQPPARFFDYQYTTGGGKNSHTYSFTVALFDCGGRNIPAFDLRPENLLHKLGEMIGFKDIDIPSAPVFSDKYRLTGENEAEVAAFFGPGPAALFGGKPGWRAQGRGATLMLTRGGGKVPASEYREFMQEAGTLASSLIK